MLANVHLSITEKATTMPDRSWQTSLTNGIVVSGMLLGWTNGAIGQVRPIADDTLGNERSTVVPIGGGTSGDRIDGGARRGDNLFHSFQEFGIDAGRSVYFSDPGVNNIITRVTGGNPSQIDGTLGVLGNANLFLINPQGIIFGANAQLDLAGSFTATTADAIAFDNQGNFSATNPTAPSLLTVQPSAFFFNQLNPGAIVNNSFAPVGVNSSSLPKSGLRVPKGKDVTLLGGNISMNSGDVIAPGGRVEIGGLSAPGSVTLNTDGSLSFPVGVARADVLLTNLSFINVAADGGGSINVNAGSLEISNSVLLAGISNNSGSVGAQAGDIMLNANTISVKSSSDIRNEVDGGIGNAGNISIKTNALYLSDGGRLRTITLGQGNAGNIIIKASDRIVLDDSAIFSTVGIRNANMVAVGDGGDISIFAGSLSLINNSQLQANTLGQGNAGNVIINASDLVTFDNSNIFTSVDTDAKGKGGDISITTGSLSLINTSQLQADTLGQGNAGNVIINAQERVTLDNSVIFSDVGDVDSDTIAVGNGGDISIFAGSLSLTNGAGLQSATIGQGNAGKVIINAQERVTLDNASAIFSSVGAPNSDAIAVGKGGDISIFAGSLSLTNGAQVSASTFGQGNAGNVIINAQERVFLDGIISQGFVSTITSSVGAPNSDTIAVGNGGDISIFAGSLSLTNGAQVSASTFGQGNAGNIIIKVDDRLSLEGVNQGKPSGIFTATAPGTQGKGGDVSITADSIGIADRAIVAASTENSFPGGSVNFNSNTFEATGGGQVTTATFGSGQAGNIILNARNRITLRGVSPDDDFSALGLGTATGLYAGTYRNSSGTGGTIEIATDNLQVFDGATVAVNSQGSGVAGNIDITAAGVELNNSSRLTAETTSVDGGNITLNDVRLLQLQGGSLISTTAGTDKAGGNGGNIDINADLIVAFPNENSDIRANAFTGSGGNVFIDSQGVFGIAFQAQDNPLTNDITASSEQGVQGTVDITPPEVDPRSGLTQLPVAVVEQSDRIAQGCHSPANRQNTNEFIVKGRGGLPPSPTDSLIGDESLASWVTVDNTARAETSILPAAKTTTAVAPIVEAQGWIVDKDGKVKLIATAPTNAAQTPLICQR